MRVPDAIEPVVGWRCWRVVDAPAGFRLLSACRQVPWSPGRPLRAACEPRGHAEPTLDCTCGIYAAAEPVVPAAYLPPHIKATATIRTQALLNYDVVMAVGLVALWGEVVECSFGWRAQFGYPARLFLPRGIRHFRRRGRVAESFDSTRVGAELGEGYGVPVEVVESLHPGALAVRA
jgi:hypothetical protein